MARVEMISASLIEGVLITKVIGGSIAAEVGLEEGDRLFAINDRVIEDVLDYRFVSSNAGMDLVMKVRKADGELWDIEIEREEEEDLGLELEEIQTRICKNNCIFCFVHQLPRGKHIRRTLRVKDEDFRLSFLYGNYLTLTNLSEADFQRILEQHLSPLYVSVHTTEPELRQYLLQSRQPDRLMENLARLARERITIHTQIVLMPGVNDGPHLKKSIFDLLSFFPSLQTVAVVPVGLTDHRQGLKPLAPVDAAYARETISIVHGYQREIRKKYGTPFGYLGDEFYILAGRPIPGRSHYGEFPILENGVGMVRRFLDEYRAAMRRKWQRPARPARGTVVTGKIFFPILEKSVGELNRKFGLDLRCVMAPSLFLGKAITVAGLLAGGDIYEAVRNRMHGDFLVVPSEAMIHEEGLFLDDWVRGDLENRLGVPVIGGGNHVADFFKLVFAAAEGAVQPRSIR